MDSGWTLFQQEEEITILSALPNGNITIKPRDVVTTVAQKSFRGGRFKRRAHSHMSYAQKLRLPCASIRFTVLLCFGSILFSSRSLLLFQTIYFLSFHSKGGRIVALTLARFNRPSPFVSFRWEFVDYNKCVCSRQKEYLFSDSLQPSAVSYPPSLLTVVKHVFCRFEGQVKIIQSLPADQYRQFDSSRYQIFSLFLLPFSLLSLEIFIIVPFIFMKSSFQIFPIKYTSVHVN